MREGRCFVSERTRRPFWSSTRTPMAPDGQFLSLTNSDTTNTSALVSQTTFFEPSRYCTWCCIEPLCGRHEFDGGRRPRRLWLWSQMLLPPSARRRDVLQSTSADASAAAASAADPQQQGESIDHALVVGLR